MTPVKTKAPMKERNIQPCNFRSAGRLSNESARALRTLHDMLARNLMNTLDVYLGAALDVRLASLEQFSMDDYRERLLGGYVLPCSITPGSHSMVIEIESGLLYTMIDLLLGGSGAFTESSDHELTEIDEEIVKGVANLIVQQVERAWQPIGVSITPGTCIRPSGIHKLFPPTEKVLLARLDVGVAGASGALHIAFPASIGGHLVRNSKADPDSVRGPVRYVPRLPIEERILECRFSVSGGLPEVRVPVRELASLAVGSVFRLGAPVDSAGRLFLEGREYFEALPVRSGKHKAIELLSGIEGVGLPRE